MCKRGENIYKRKDGRWEGRFIVSRKENGKPKFRSVYAHSYTKVRQLLAEARTQRAVPARQTVLFKDWCGYWLEEIEAPCIKESTYQNYRRIIEKHLLPAFGRLPLPAIGKEAVLPQIEHWRKSLASSTASGVYRVFKSIMTKARQRNLCDFSFDEVRLAGKCKRPRVLTITEQRRLEGAASGEMRLIICLGLYLGLRVGEICGLCWEDVDWAQQTLSVRRTVQRVKQQNGKTVLVVGTPKSDYGQRELPLPKPLLHLLQEAHSQGSPKGFLFPGKSGMPIDPRTIQLRFSKMLKCVYLKDVHMHTLRHTFATRCLEQHIGIAVLSELLGHSSVQITLNYYAHCTVAEKMSALRQLPWLL